MKTAHVVFFSGGIGSWAAAKLVAAKHGTEHLTLLFTDTKIEDEDLYRFLDETAKSVGGRLVKIADGRTPWEVFRDERFLGNSRSDPCSKILKRNLARRWVKANCDRETTTLYVGIDYTEEHRLRGTQERWKGWNVQGPLCEPPYPSKDEIFDWLRRAEIRPPRLYEMGFSHNNCGGFCIKAGQAHFARLREVMPERYAHHEAQEASLREHLGKNVSILKDRRGGKSRPMTLREFRERECAGDPHEWGGCGCFVG